MTEQLLGILGLGCFLIIATSLVEGEEKGTAQGWVPGLAALGWVVIALIFMIRAAVGG